MVVVFAITTLLFMTVVLPSAHSAVLHVDAHHGDDQNDGTADSPLRTLGQAIRAVRGGDVISLSNGKYDVVVAKRRQGEHLFDGEYVTIKPAADVAYPLDAVSIRRIDIAVTGKVTPARAPWGF
jgi:hypothetical protein